MKTKYGDLLLELLGQPEDERQAFLEARGATPEVCAELLELINREAEIDGFLERPAVLCIDPVGEPTTPDRPRDGKTGPQKPERVGPYTIKEVLGEGGMGIVYLAEQRQPVERQLAVKVVKATLAAPEAAARFDAERQALARLSHPNIAQLYEAGTTDDGYPYFAMEHVSGVPLTQFCDQQRLQIRQRLLLFATICDAVQHAHQRGIIHRDIKPSNILVTVVDGQPIAKVIDFGIAKAVGRPLSDDLELTGDRVIGTPAYMSPESLRLVDGVADIDTRADVYSLGILMYELLTGLRPFSTHDGVEQIVAMIARTDAPTPSDRLASQTDDTRESVAMSRGTELAALRRSLTGDLDWIVGMAINKDREERYASAAELAADIRRHLTHQPVMASPPSVPYRVAKFVRRYRTLVAVGTVALLALVAGTIGTSIGMVRAKRAEAAAGLEADNAQQTIELLEQFLSSADPANQGKDVLLVDLLEDFRPRLESLQDKPLIQARLYSTYARTYEGLGLWEESRSCNERALGLRKDLLGDEHMQTIQSLNAVAIISFRQGRYDEAATHFQECLRIKQQVLGDDNPETAKAMNNLAMVQSMRGKHTEAERVFRQGFEMRTRLLGHDHADTLSSLNNLAISIWKQGRPGEAEKLFRQCLEARERTLGKEHPITLSSLNNLAGTLIAQERLDEAEGLNRRCLKISRRVRGDDHPTTLMSLSNLAETLMAQGRFDEAEELLRQCLEARQRVLGAEHPEVEYTLADLAETLVGAGRSREAETLIRQLLTWSKHQTLRSMSILCISLLQQDRLDEAQSLTIEVTNTLNEEPEIDEETARSLYLLGTRLEQRAMNSQAITCFRGAAANGNQSAESALIRLGDE